MSFKEELATKIKARFPIIFLTSFEERRVERLLNDICNEQKKSLVVWTATRGFTDGQGKTIQQGASDLEQALTQVIAEAKQKKVIYLFEDVTKFIDANDKVYYRMLRDAVEVLKASQSTVILLSPMLSFPRELEKSLVVLDVPYPDKAELKAVLDKFVQVTKAVKQDIQLPTPEEEDTILRSGAGLTEDEFENVVAESLVRYKRVDMAMIVAQKEQILRKAGIDLYQTLDGLQNVGGLGALKEWILRRALAFSEKAREFGVRAPRGILIGGVTGCGKSLTAKCMAAELKQPLMVADPARILGSFVGQSEQNLKMVLKTAESIAPAILMFDEVEKILTTGVGAGDSGVSSRLFGAILTWMNETPAQVIVVCTSNDPLRLPPEFQSRFDAVWFVDLPTLEERKEVWAVQVKKARRKPEQFDLVALAEASESWSGREMEMCVSEALVRAFEAEHDLDTATLLQVISERIPLAIQRREEIEKQRSWGSRWALKASKSVSAQGDGDSRPLEM